MEGNSRVVIVAADGADPDVFARLVEAGRLPTLARLCAEGTWGRLKTTFPPLSPVAWMSCLCGVSPARHGIRDFVIKLPHTYLPTIGLFHVQKGKDGIPVYRSRRRAPTLGELLSEAGRSSYVLRVPGLFPPPPIQGGTLAGFGMPDLLGTFGLSAWYTTDPEGKMATAEGESPIRPLEPVGRGEWRGVIPGPAGSKRTFVARAAGNGIELTVDIGGRAQLVTLAPGEWSGWVRLSFPVPGRGAIDGMCRFKLVGVGQGLELYRTAVQCVPDAPLFPFDEPPGFGAWLASKVGPFATLGMPSDMDGVRRGVVDPETFLEDAYHNWERQVEVTLHLLEEPSWDLLMTHFFTIDNVQHLFWHYQDSRHPAYDPHAAVRFGGEIERAYRWLDMQVKRLLDRLPPRTTLLLISDHGCKPIYRHFYLNAWLRSRGYLTPRDADAPDGTLRIDWERTRAAMFGTGGIWINLQGREPRGVVPPGAPYEALRNKLIQELLELRDPLDGQRVVRAVLGGEEVYGAKALSDGPDLVPALRTGYGLGRGEGMGRVASGRAMIAPNHTPWSGGHEGPYLPDEVAGIYLFWGDRVPAGAKIGAASLVDIAPTVLSLVGIKSPVAMEGHPLL